MLEDTNILIDINIDVSVGVVTLLGPRETVGNANHEISTKLNKIAENRTKHSQAQQLKTLIQWNYEEVTEIDCILRPYDDILNYDIEMAFTAGKKTFQFHDDAGQEFVIDFLSLKEYPSNNIEDKLRVVRKNILVGE